MKWIKVHLEEDGTPLRINMALAQTYMGSAHRQALASIAIDKDRYFVRETPEEIDAMLGIGEVAEPPAPKVSEREKALVSFVRCLIANDSMAKFTLDDEARAILAMPEGV